MKSLKTLLLSFFVASQLSAQVNAGTDSIAIARDTIAIPDTIELARSSAYQKDFEKADHLLTKYNVDHLDIHALRLHAQVLYWMKAFDRSIEVYEKATHLFPEPSSLHLDYARVLFSLNKLPKAHRLLNAYRKYDSINVEAIIMTAYIELWNGKIGAAGKKADLLLKTYPDNAEAKDIKSNITNWTVPYVKTGVGILSDDQPLKGNNFYAEAGVYRSWLFAPTVQAAMYRYSAEETRFRSSWLQLSNTIQLGTKDKIKLKGGLFQQNSNSSEFTGGAEVSHQITRHFLFQAGLERRPYQYTISSIRSAVMESVTGIGLSYNRNNKWFGKAGYESYQYGDANKIHVAYLWVLAPIISRPHFSISGGYAFRYADALKSTFVSKQSLDEVINNWPPTNGIPGVYNPYFTPENQLAHSALLSIKITPLKKLQFSSRLNIAFSAKADNPYLFVDSHDSGLFFNMGFAQVDYMPTSWVNELSIAASNKFYITANYTYDELLYYKSHRAGIELKYLFLK